jgi:hypothetical protein
MSLETAGSPTAFFETNLSNMQDHRDALKNASCLRHGSWLELTSVLKRGDSVEDWARAKLELGDTLALNSYRERGRHLTRMF